MLEKADVRIDGDRPWDIQVHNDSLYSRILAEGTLGVGESYMDGWWDCPAIDQLVYRIVTAGIEDQLRTWTFFVDLLKAKLRNLQSRKRAFQIGQRHYDIGNDIFEAMLDSRMNYSCGYWARADNLEDAQLAKLELIAHKLMLEPGMRVLDIGCGWGGAARYYAKNYGVDVVGVTVSREQVALANQLRNGLPVEIRLADYRDVDESFDRVYSIGMFEHVGPKNYRAYMEVVHRCLDKGGYTVLHTVGTEKRSPHNDPWNARYIFPNGVLPSPGRITDAASGLLILEDWQNFGLDYDRTLMSWYERFERAWPELKSSYEERFRRMWRYYLLGFAGLVRARGIQLWQIVFSVGQKTAYRPDGIR